MIDIEAFKKDFKTEVQKLPKDLVKILKDLSEKFGPTLDKLVPQMLQNLGRHVQAIMMASAMNQLDKDELNATITEVLRESL